MNVRLLLPVLGALSFVTPSTSAQTQAPATPDQVVAGYIERISLPDLGLVFEAKLDTGADSSSINGSNIEKVRRDAGWVVKFALTDETHQGAIGAGIDLATGRTLTAVHRNKIVTNHPDTLAAVTDVEIPHFAKILDIAAKCNAMTGLGFIGVDLVIDRDKGP